MAWMYIVRCRDGSFYTGSTAIDVESRIWRHNHDDELAASYTRRRRPVALAYVEQFARVDDAFARE
jgi:putative endonuclease